MSVAQEKQTETSVLLDLYRYMVLARNVEETEQDFTMSTPYLEDPGEAVTAMAVSPDGPRI